MKLDSLFLCHLFIVSLASSPAFIILLRKLKTKTAAVFPSFVQKYTPTAFSDDIVGFKDSIYETVDSVFNKINKSLKFITESSLPKCF